MQIEHIAMYVKDLEGMRAFYETWFGACAGELYHNPRTDFRSYFLTFSDGTRLEIMHRPDVECLENSLERTGFIHLAFRTGSRDQVDGITAALKQAGFPVVSGPRTTGDGYYESCILDPEGNRIEITV